MGWCGSRAGTRRSLRRGRETLWMGGAASSTRSMQPTCSTRSSCWTRRGRWRRARGRRRHRRSRARRRGGGGHAAMRAGVWEGPRAAGMPGAPQSTATPTPASGDAGGSEVTVPSARLARRPRHPGSDGGVREDLAAVAAALLHSVSAVCGEDADGCASQLPAASLRLLEANDTDARSTFGATGRRRGARAHGRACLRAPARRLSLLLGLARGLFQVSVHRGPGTAMSGSAPLRTVPAVQGSGSPRTFVRSPGGWS